jgi:hypothetical protein
MFFVFFNSRPPSRAGSLPAIPGIRPISGACLQQCVHNISTIVGYHRRSRLSSKKYGQKIRKVSSRSCPSADGNPETMKMCERRADVVRASRPRSRGRLAPASSSRAEPVLSAAPDRTVQGGAKECPQVTRSTRSCKAIGPLRLHDSMAPQPMDARDWKDTPAKRSAPCASVLHLWLSCSPLSSPKNLVVKKSQAALSAYGTSTQKVTLSNLGQTPKRTICRPRRIHLPSHLHLSGVNPGGSGRGGTGRGGAPAPKGGAGRGGIAPPDGGASRGGAAAPDRGASKPGAKLFAAAVTADLATLTGSS